ncbi:hypothetical protein FRC11_008827, partial [Ceratobasidium sp. 423]
MSPLPAPSTSPSETSSYNELTADQIKKLPDAVVWSWPDEIILAASRAKWRAPVYDHYTPSVERSTDELGQKTIRYRFTCKSNPQQHKALYRLRGDDSSGTKKLIDAATRCDLRCNAIQPRGGSTAQAPEFSWARFRALLVLWCARNHRPFEMVNDDLFAAIVNELRP